MLELFVHAAEKQIEPVLRLVEPVLRDFLYPEPVLYVPEPVLMKIDRILDSLSIIEPVLKNLRTGSMTYTMKISNNPPPFLVYLFRT